MTASGASDQAASRRIVVGVGGGIAAYKVASLVRLFTESGHHVTVVPTESALRFVGAATWEALSGRPVSTDVWSRVPEVPHVRIGKAADLVVVAPATADLLAKAAAGMADDLLTATLLTARCPVVFAPAMHTEMWDHPATQANVATLTSRGAHLIPPASGRLTGADTGPGRLPEPEEIFAVCVRLLEARPDSDVYGVSGQTATEPREHLSSVPGGPGPLAGRRVVVTAGGTREPIDPVRFLGNRSSGKQGYALASVAAARGASVTLISANPTLAEPAGVDVVPVGTALELQDAVTRAAKEADVVVMAAAVADFRPRTVAQHKVKKTYATTADGVADESAPVIELVRNPDILAGLVEARGGADRPVLVGFAAETGDETGSVLELARSKLARKACDVLVANEVGEGMGFGTEGNTVHVLYRPGLVHNGGESSSPPDFSAGPAPKAEIAAAVWDGIQAILQPR